MGGGTSIPRVCIPRNRVFVVTGGNSGIGYETSKCIAMMGGHVINRTSHVNMSNYMGHLLITIKLLPITKKSGEDLRIVNNSSLGHLITDFDANNIQRSKGNRNDTWDFYNKTKGYQIMQMFTMNRKLSNKDVTINCINPGVVRTPFFDKEQPDDWITCVLSCYRRCCCTKAQSEGGASLIDAAVNPKYKGRCDLYISDLKEKLPKNYTRNREYQETLWRYSMEKLSKYLTEEDMSIFNP